MTSQFPLRDPQRELARELAVALRANGLSIFFDELFEHEMRGRDGADYLNDIFFRQSSYTVALVSKDYERAAWAQLERRAAQAQELRVLGVLIPVLIDDIQPEWLLPTRIYFNLQRRSIQELVEALVKKIHAHPGGQYQLAAEIFDIYEEAPIYVSRIEEEEQFLVWCPLKSEPAKKLHRISKDQSSGKWITTSLSMCDREARYLFSMGPLIISVPDNADEPIRIDDINQGKQASFLSDRNFSRQYKWNMITDCKISNGSLLLSHCGGDIWHLPLHTRKATEIIKGGSGVEYSHADFADRESIVFGSDNSREITVATLRGGQPLRGCTLPESTGSIAAFPGSNLVVVGGSTQVFVLALDTLLLQHEFELGSKLINLLVRQYDIDSYWGKD